MASTDTIIGSSDFEISRIIEEHRRQDEKRRVKRAANRKSASTSRARKKAYLDEMMAKNERMKQYAFVLSLLPDLVLAVCRTGEMTYVSPACQWLLLHSPEDLTGANIFELVAPECHPMLRKLISENLARPVKTKMAAAVGGAARDGCPSKWQFPGSRSQSEAGGDDEGSETDQSDDDDVDDDDEEDDDDDDESQSRKKPGSHSSVRGDRLQQRHRHSKAGEGRSVAYGGGGGGGGGLPAPPPPVTSKTKAEMLRLFRGDKTTVWCESRLSVRIDKSDSSKLNVAPAPLEIVLTLRTVEEGAKTIVAHEFAGGNLCLAHQDADAETSSPGAEAPRAVHVGAVAERVVVRVDEDAFGDYVAADDDGYQCEVEAEEDSNNSGSGNDSTARRKSPAPGGGGIGTSSGSKGERSVAKRPCDASGAQETAEDTEDLVVVDPMVGREERSLSKKRQRVRISKRMEEMGSTGSEKSVGDYSSTGGDTGGSTTHEGSGSSSNSNEVDSNGEGSSKWGGGDSGSGSGCVPASYRNCGGGSEDGDGASEGSSTAGTDFEDVQTAVQSLILMGGDLKEVTQ